jgi:hypothetical protein
MSNKNDGQDEEEDEARERDLPGQIDSQRGRGAYSAAEKAFDQSTERATATQRGREFGDSEKERAGRQQEAMFQLQINHQSNLNGLQSAFVAALQAVMVMGLASQATNNDSQSASLVGAVAEVLSKTAGVTPPVTVNPVKGA